MCIESMEGVLLPHSGRACARPGWGAGMSLPFDFADARHQPAFSSPSPSGGDDLARRIGPKGRLESRALLRRFPQVRDLDFLRSTRRYIGAPQISGFWTVGLVWNSSDLSSEMSLFNGLHATPGPFLIHAALSPQSGDTNTRLSFDPKVDRAETLGEAETAGRAKTRQSTSQGPNEHWDETNAAFAFWQEIVELGAGLRNVRAAGNHKARKSPTGARPSITPAHAQGPLPTS